MTVKPRIRTLHDIQIRRRTLKQKIETTAALIGEQWQQLESKVSPPRIDLNLMYYIAKILALVALSKASRPRAEMKSTRLDKNSKSHIWREWLSVIPSLLVGLVSRRANR